MHESSRDPGHGIERAAKATRAAEALLVTAGSGMGVDSGLPDFRGTKGFWRTYPALAKLGVHFEEMANPEWFERAPELAWAFYGHRLNLYRAATPHAGFRQLLEMGRRKAHGAFVFTSNVDGHFQKAGFDPGRIVECHGSIHHFQCCHVCADDVWDASAEVVNVNEESFCALPPLPACRHCPGLARPNVLMFGDEFWLPRRTNAQRAALAKWIDQLKRERARVVVIELGAGTAIATVRSFSEQIARQLSATLIRINPHETEVPGGAIALPLGAAEGVRQICGEE